MSKAHTALAPRPRRCVRRRVRPEQNLAIDSRSTQLPALSHATVAAMTDQGNLHVGLVLGVRVLFRVLGQ